MKKHLIFAVLTISLNSCTSDKVAEVENLEVEISEESETPDEAPLDENLFGKWLIDSTAENGNLNIRAAVITEYLEFTYLNQLQVSKLVEGQEEGRLLGTAISVADSVYVLNSDGVRLMSYYYKLDGDNLTLHAGNSMKLENGNTLTLFLTKVASSLL